LNLPGLDGREVLKSLKADRRLNSIPIIVLTGSSAEQDIISAYAAGANCYIQKPMELSELFQSMAELLKFWMETATLPPNDYIDRPKNKVARW
jgi:two-component system response regulator